MKGLLFLAGLLLFNTAFTQSKSEKAAIDWVNENAVPLKSVHAESGLDDLASLDGFIGDARIVAFGECTHGSSEIFSMKHRMLEYLVKKKGFTIFSIEANMPESYALNEYIINGKGDPKILLSGLYFWTWNTQEVLDMIEWMKKYNETAEKKIFFTGFDMQSTSAASSIARSFLVKTGSDGIPVLDKYDSLYKANMVDNYGSKRIYPGMKEAAETVIERVKAVKHAPNDTSYAWAYQNAVILLQFANLFNELTPEDENRVRDKYMAENLEWIAANNPDARIMIWAHNDHVRKGKGKWNNYLNMGGYLKDAFGSQFMAVGFSTEEGTYTARIAGKKGGPDSANVLTASTKGDVEFLLKQARYDNFLIPFKNVEEGTKETDWIFKKMNLRSLGAVASDKYQFFEHKPALDYDGIIFLKHTSSSRCFRIGAGKQNVEE